jgi:hypothetical protein
MTTSTPVTTARHAVPAAAVRGDRSRREAPGYDNARAAGWTTGNWPTAVGVLAVVSAAQFLIVLDLWVVNIALPTLQHNFAPATLPDNVRPTRRSCCRACCCGRGQRALPAFAVRLHRLRRTGHRPAADPYPKAAKDGTPSDAVRARSHRQRPATSAARRSPWHWIPGWRPGCSRLPGHQRRSAARELVKETEMDRRQRARA